MAFGFSHVHRLGTWHGREASVAGTQHFRGIQHRQASAGSHPMVGVASGATSGSYDGRNGESESAGRVATLPAHAGVRRCLTHLVGVAREARCFDGG